MDLASAKMIGAGLAVIALAGVGVGIGNIFGNLVASVGRNPAIRAMLKSNAVPHQEAFLVGAGMGHQVMGEAAGLPFTKDIESWFA